MRALGSGPVLVVKALLQATRPAMSPGRRREPAGHGPISRVPVLEAGGSQVMAAPVDLNAGAVIAGTSYKDPLDPAGSTTERELSTSRHIAKRARAGDEGSASVLFVTFSRLGTALAPWPQAFGAGALVVGDAMTGPGT